MSRFDRSIALFGATLLAASGSLWAADETPPASAVSAEASDCIPLSRIQSTKVLDDRTILFHLNGGQTLVNHLPHRCGGLGIEKAFGYKTSLSQLCSTDIIWVVRQTGGRLDRGASCGLGKFEPYVEPAADKAAQDNGKLEPM